MLQNAVFWEKCLWINTSYPSFLMTHKQKLWFKSETGRISTLVAVTSKYLQFFLFCPLQLALLFLFPLPSNSAPPHSYLVEFEETQRRAFQPLHQTLCPPPGEFLDRNWVLGVLRALAITFVLPQLTKIFKMHSIFMYIATQLDKEQESPQTRRRVFLHDRGRRNHSCEWGLPTSLQWTRPSARPKQQAGWVLRPKKSCKAGAGLSWPLTTAAWQQTLSWGWSIITSFVLWRT